MIDLNDTPLTPPPRLNLREVKARLQATAADWAPRLFPAARISPDRRVLRMANLGGDPPREHGSAEVRLSGPYAGYGRDWATDDRADPIELIRWATGLCNGDLYAEAARIAGMALDRPASKPRVDTSPKDNTPEARRVLSTCQPLVGSVAETYLNKRGVDNPGSPDLMFAPDLTDRASRTGWPGMVGIIRDGDGQPTGGIHRTFLTPEGDKAPPGKKMLGPAKAGHVRLFPLPEDGHLGLAEGIETALSAHRLFGIPTWAGLSADGVRTFQWPGGVTRLTLFADAGEAGRNAAEALAARVRQAGIDVSLLFPLHGDDFNDDLKHGVTAADYAVAPPSTQAAAEVDDGPTLVAEAATLARGDSAGAIGIIDRLVRAGLETLEEESILGALKAATGLSMGGLRKQVATMRRRWNASGGDSTARLTSPWAHRLRVDAAGQPERNEANVMVALAHDTAFGGALVLDTFAEKILVYRALPWSAADETFPRQWTDADDVHLAVWLQRRDVNVTPLVVARSVTAYARAQAVHPVRDYLDGLAWDGTARLDTWLADFVGAEDTRLTRAFAARWMISAVARIRRPGCKVDHMLVLEGAQGLKKSSAFKTLCGAAWFTDELAEVGSKDAAMQLQGAWVVEMAELDAMSKAETGRVKAFLSRTTDRYRPPYGRHTVEVPRQSVLCGTVNHETWLKDETGGRRFWPVKAGVTGAIDLDGLAAARDQLWAEAVARFEAGEPWWLDEQDLVAEAAEAQEAKRVTDAWDDRIDHWLTHTTERVPVGYNTWEDREVERPKPITETSVAEVLEHAIGLDPGRWSTKDQARIGRYFIAHGWKSHRPRAGGDPKRARRYYKATEPSEQGAC